MSLSPSITDYPFENGRRYHAFRSGNYMLPNDEPELDRLDLSHAIMTRGINDRLFLAPINVDETRRILDIGTGTGIWAIEMGDEFPECQVIGNDLSAVQPTWYVGANKVSKKVPPNVIFEVDDVESPWMHARPFDFIFCRYMAGCIEDWPKLVENIYQNVEINGWAEFQDFDLQYYSDDGSFNETHDTFRWLAELLEGCRIINREPCPGPQLVGWAQKAGFQNIRQRIFKIPIGEWPSDPRSQELGRYNLMQMLDGVEAFSLRVFCSVLGWTSDEVAVMLARVRQELKSRNLHIYLNFHVVYGQRLQ